MRSAFNVGSVFRNCDGAGVDKIVLAGYTPTPDNPKVRKTSLNSELSVKWEHVLEYEDLILNYKSLGLHIFSIENKIPGFGYKSINLFDYEFSKGVSGVFIFGNEVTGINDHLLGMSDQILFLPMCGIKNSLNISSCSAVVAYELLRRINHGIH